MCPPFFFCQSCVAHSPAMIDNLVLVTDPALPGDSNPLNVQLFLAHRFQWDSSPDLEQHPRHLHSAAGGNRYGARESSKSMKECVYFFARTTFCFKMWSEGNPRSAKLRLERGGGAGLVSRRRRCLDASTQLLWPAWNIRRWVWVKFPH